MEEQLLAFLSHLEKEYRYSENTVAAYRNDLGQFLEYVEGRAGSRQSDWAAVSEDIIDHI